MFAIEDRKTYKCPELPHSLLLFGEFMCVCVCVSSNSEAAQTARWPQAVNKYINVRESSSAMRDADLKRREENALQCTIRRHDGGESEGRRYRREVVTGSDNERWIKVQEDSPHIFLGAKDCRSEFPVSGEERTRGMSWQLDMNEWLFLIVLLEEKKKRNTVSHRFSTALSSPLRSHLNFKRYC